MWWCQLEVVSGCRPEVGECGTAVREILGKDNPPGRIWGAFHPQRAVCFFYQHPFGSNRWIKVDNGRQVACYTFRHRKFRWKRAAEPVQPMLKTSGKTKFFL